MKKLYTLLFFCSSAIMSTAQEQQASLPKLSPLTRHYLQEIKKTGAAGLQPGYVYKKLSNGQEYISALIKVSDASVAAEQLKQIGAFVGTKAGNIWTVQVSPGQVEAFTRLSGISYIQLDEPVHPNLDIARKTTRVDSVQKGYNLPMPYSGKNVIAGIIDFGFDYNHPTFYDTLGARYRIKKVWELNATGTPPNGYNYGAEVTDTTLIKARGTDNALQMHGTSVAGIAAGSGYGSPNNYTKLRGMAYDADLILVGVRRDSIANQWMESGFSDFIDGVNYIFTQADAAGKPAVVNISWGSQSGAHDGTSLFNQACDNLSGAGKLIVMSAGNEGEEKIHLSKTFSATDTVLKTFLTFTPATYKRTWVDIWGEPGKTFCAKATLYSNGVAGSATQTICIDSLTHDLYLIGANGTDTCYVEFITSPSEQNGKPRITMNIFNKASDSVGIAISGNSGTINAWDEYYYYGFTHGYQSAFDSLGNSWATTGNTISTTSDMGAAQSVLLVGAYASKVAWTDINLVGWSYGSYVPTNRLVPFSSHGPMLDGRIKPDITAPGLTLSTSVSSYDTSYTPTGTNSSKVTSQFQDPVSGKKYYFAEFIGTSASAPAASGITALLLQADPHLTPQQLKNIISTTAITDVYTGSIPATGNNTWGHGKINAYSAIKKAIQQAGVYNFNGKKLDCVLYPNPNNGNFTIDYTGEKTETLRITVYNINGALANADTWQVAPGDNRRQLNLSHLAAGTYMVHITSADGAVGIKTVIR
ncbi:S8/S53 family peptidase [Chitinophagaceae bacterium MMS25-I14]